MELAIPLVALGGLYFVFNKDKKDESFVGQRSSQLPNTNIPNQNFPSEYPILSQETQLTSQLSTLNAIDSPSVYTDKYFNPELNGTTVKSYTNMSDADSNNVKDYYSLTGNKVDSSYYKHNNMIPYFGGKIRTRGLDANSNEGILDSYQGQGSQNIAKQEQSPLFSPGENYNYAFGAPNMNDFYQSRVNPSLRMANVKPFEEQKVAPGLGLGYTTEGSGGYNSGMMERDKWLDRGVDELRVANHQKHSEVGLLGREGPAISSITYRGEHAPVNKNHQNTAFELGADRLFTTMGIETAPTSRGVYIEPAGNYRPETTTSYSGIAGAAVDATYKQGEYMQSIHQDLGAVPIGVATGKGGATDADYGIKSKFAYPNNRTANHENNPDNYFGMVSGVVNAAIAPLLDVLRPSRKENTIGNLRLYENAGSTVPSSYIFNPADRTNTTIRETTEKNNYIYGVNANQRGGGYETNEYQAAPNERDTTSVYYGGSMSAANGTLAARTYDAEYNQRNNDIKASTIDGRMVPGNMNLLNTDINQRARNGELKNQRALAVTAGPTQLYSSGQMGVQGLETKPLYQTIQLDRNTPDMLDAFRQNPYTHSLTNIA